MFDTGTSITKALAQVDHFYVKLRDSGVIQINAFQYEIAAEISMETYSKFMSVFCTLVTSLEAVLNDIYLKKGKNLTENDKIQDNQGNSLNQEEQENGNVEQEKDLIEDNVNSQYCDGQQKAVDKKQQCNSVKNKESFACDYCDETFTSLKVLYKHTVQTHTDSDGISPSFYLCTECGECYLSECTLEEHVSYTHDESVEFLNDEKVHWCPFCGEMYTSYLDVAAHLSSAHEHNYCYVCASIFSSDTSLSLHINANHVKGILNRLDNCVLGDNCSDEKLLRSAPSDVVIPTGSGQEFCGADFHPQTMSEANGYMSFLSEFLDISQRPLKRKRGRPRKLKNDTLHLDFPCLLCRAKFPSKESLEKHLSYSHVLMPQEIHCSFCNLKFKRKSALNNHINLVHNNQNESSDQLDSKVTSETHLNIVVCDSDVQSHTNIVSATNQEQCNSATSEGDFYYSFTPAIGASNFVDSNRTGSDQTLIEEKSQDLLSSVPVVESDKDPAFSDRLTNSVTPDATSASLLSRDSSVKNTGEICVTSRGNEKKNTLLEISNCRTVPKRKAKSKCGSHCNICGEALKSLSDRKVHEDKHQLNGSFGLFQCLYCKESAMTKDKLKSHVESDHRYKCPFCSDTFSWKRNLESHLVKEHGQRVVCQICGDHLGSAKALRFHHLRRHVSEKQYLCLLCGKKFPTAGNLRQHELIHVDKSKRKYECNICHARFNERSCLRMHLMRHSGEKPHICMHCNMRFVSATLLRQHSMRHLGIKKFQCICGKKFQEQRDFRKHKKQHNCSKPDDPTIVIHVPSMEIEVNTGQEEDCITLPCDTIGSEVDVVVPEGLLQALPITQASNIEDDSATQVPVLHVEDDHMEVILGETVHILDSKHSKPTQLDDVLTFVNEPGANSEEIVYEENIVEADCDEVEISNSTSDVSVVYVQSGDNEEIYNVVELVEAS